MKSNADSAISKMCEGRDKSRTCKKPSMTDLSSKNSNFLTLKDDDKKPWKKNDFSNARNNSTLSLHISAYENSIKEDASNSIGEKDCMENAKSEIIKQIFTVSSFVINNPFEFPRQQNDKVPEPEMSQFKAFQRLVNPNGIGKRKK